MTTIQGIVVTLWGAPSRSRAISVQIRRGLDRVELRQEFPRLIDAPPGRVDRVAGGAKLHAQEVEVVPRFPQDLRRSQIHLLDPRDVAAPHRPPRFSGSCVAGMTVS